MTQTTTITAGIDTAKDKLDIAGHGQAGIVTVQNNAAGWDRLAAQLCDTFDDDSGQHRGQRHIAGGRGRLRRSLYAAALPAAFRWNPALKALYSRLVKRGQCHKTALVACARKLLVFANTVVGRDTPWKPAA